MKIKTIQESYTDFLDNKISRREFHRLINNNQFARKYVSPLNVLEDSIGILKARKVLFERIEIDTPQPEPEVQAQPEAIQAPSVNEIERINQPDYKFYTYSVDQAKLVGGFSTPDEARNKAKEMVSSGKGPAKVVNSVALKNKLHLDPNDNGAWGDDGVADPDGNDELSELNNSKIQADIDSMLNELRNSFLPEEAEQPVNEISFDTMQSAKNKMHDKGQDNRAAALNANYFRSLKGHTIDSLGKVQAAEYSNNYGAFIITMTDIDPLKKFHFTAEYYPKEDRWKLPDGASISRAGARQLGKLAKEFNPNTQYLKGTGDFKIQGY